MIRSWPLRFCFISLWMLALTSTARAQLDLQLPSVGGEKTDLITITPTIESADPFDESRRAVNPKPLKVRRGTIVKLVVTNVPKTGYYTYALNTYSDEYQAVTTFDLVETPGIVPLWPVKETEPVAVEVPELKATYLQHRGKFTWEQDLLVLPDAKPGKITIPIKVALQVCKKNCTQLELDSSVSFEISDEPAQLLTAELEKRKAEKRPERKFIALNGSQKPAPKKQTPVAVADAGAKHDVGLITGSAKQYEKSIGDIIPKLNHRTEAETGLLAFILAGVFWGAISLVTPCVFPMIPITVSFFLKQSENKNNRPIVMATVYSLTIVFVLTLAATFLLQAFRWLSINPVMNYALGGLFIFFALSLFGMYEIELPSGLARFTSAREGQGGMVGTIFMALTFTIISFACVAPFLGGFGGTAGTQARPLWHNMLGGLAFSVTFAAPFFILALFPALLRKLPKSGSWLNSVKVVMGFLELAAAFKFFRAAELVGSSTPTLFTYDFVLGIWIALCLLCGLYLLGFYRLPHDSPVETIGVPRMLFAAAFLSLGFYFTPALFKLNAEGQSQRPKGSVYAWVDSFLLPDSPPATGEKIVTGNLPHAIAQAREEMRRTNRPKRLFLDFTGKS